MREPDTDTESKLQHIKQSESSQVDQTIAFIWHSHSHLSEVTRNCDIKASIVLAWTTALIGGLFTIEFHHFVVGTHHNLDFEGWTKIPVQIGAFVSLILLSASFAFATFAVTPRYQSPDWGAAEPGYIYWKSILAHGSEKKLLDFLASSSGSDHLQHLSEHLYRIAKIADTKHRRTSVSLWLASFGSMVAGATSLAA
ncbi:Pycsar system effector family protein [Gimesia panareensis]|uniref:Pycsar system effector family protein n=1 Tax=Gimesia panareensis TaxID=2527978 RepID=UPI00118CEE7B|nr:Pycsar system effector family protein [Gimesia panareensis]QDU53131.1 hypothetical protein Pan110_55150 [Gimesia panareensis]